MDQINQPLCQGCGQVMQDRNPNESNYVLNLEFELCMRCFRWRHYKDLPLLIKPIVNVKQHTSLTLPEHDELLVVVDAFFLKETLLPLIPWMEHDKKVTICVTKKDILAKQISDQQVIQHVKSLLPKNLKSIDVIVFSTKIKSSIDKARLYFDRKPTGYKVALIGMINAGKSSLLNALLADSSLTTSPYPQTTLDPVVRPYKHMVLIDTPGLSNYQHLFYHMDPKIYQRTIPTTTIKPIVYQLIHQQSIVIDDLCVINVSSQEKVSITVYVAATLNVKRKKQLQHAHDWINHDAPVTTILKPSEDGIDFIIEGIGKIHGVGHFDQVEVISHPKITISKSKGMITW